MKSKDAETEISGWKLNHLDACRKSISLTPIPAKEIKLSTELAKNTTAYIVKLSDISKLFNKNYLMTKSLRGLSPLSS